MSFFESQSDFSSENFFRPKDLLFDIPGAISRLNPLMTDMERGNELESVLEGYYPQFHQLFETQLHKSSQLDNRNKGRLSTIPLVFTFDPVLSSDVLAVEGARGFIFREKYNYRSYLFSYEMTLLGNKEGRVDQIGLRSINSSTEAGYIPLETDIYYSNGKPFYITIEDESSKKVVEFGVPDPKSGLRCYPRSFEATPATFLPSFPNECYSRRVHRNSK